MIGRRHRRGVLSALLLCGLVAAACSSGDDGPSIRLNEVQVLGSHNSYHLRPGDPVLAGIGAFSAPLAARIDYEHLPLDDQLRAHGIRQFEIDVYADPDGGRFASRPALELIGLAVDADDPALDRPGFKVMHMVDIDFRSTCLTLVACLGEIESWSAATPDHLPVMVMIEAKQDSLTDLADSIDLQVPDLGVALTDVLPMDRALFDELEAEILEVFARDRLITPDDVRGDADTLEAAVLAGDAWPTLDEARGKVLFALGDTGDTRDVYVGDAPSLEGRLLFTTSEEGRPDAAFVQVDDPVADGGRIRELVTAGYLVRTRSDVPGVEAASGDVTRRDAALASGAQYVSTDYYVADPTLGTGYVVTIPGGSSAEPAARCNPVTAPPECNLGAP